MRITEEHLRRALLGGHVGGSLGYWGEPISNSPSHVSVEGAIDLAILAEVLTRIVNQPHIEVRATTDQDREASAALDWTPIKDGVTASPIVGKREPE